MLELLKKLFNDELKLTILVPLILTVSGDFIINYHLLGYYGIIDYHLFNVQSIYAGTLGVFFLGITYSWFHLLDDGCQSKFGLCCVTIIKIALASICVYFYPVMYYYKNKILNNYKLDLLSYFQDGMVNHFIRNIFWYYLCFAGIMVGIYYYLIKTKQSNRSGRLKDCFLVFLIIGSLFATITAIFMYCGNVADFRDLAHFFTVIGSLYLFLKLFNDFSAQPIGKNPLHWVFVMFALLLALVFYTKGVYPFIASCFGGGHSEFIKIDLKEPHSNEKPPLNKKPFEKARIIHKVNKLMYIEVSEKRHQVIYMIDENEVEKITYIERELPPYLKEP